MKLESRRKHLFFFNLFFAYGLLDIIDMYKRKHVLDFNTVKLNNGK